MKATTGLAGVVGMIVLSAGGYLAWKHMPPYERGLHTTVVGGAVDAPPHIGGCPVLPADNVWNTPIDTLPKLPNSQVYVESTGATRKMHPDFGSNLNYGIPFTEIPPGTPPVPVSFEYDEDSDHGSYPIPADAPVEGGSSASGDCHVIAVDPGDCMLYELYHAERQSDGSWSAGSGVRIDLRNNALRADGKTSADAAGLPILPGLVRYDEVASGEIRHALRFTLPHTRAAYVWPARHRASPSTDQRLVPLGTRFRLRADFDLSEYPRSARIILTALKRYGMFLADNGSALYLSGVSDKRWNNKELRSLGGVTAADLEAVDESGLEVEPNSGKAHAEPTP